MVKKLLITAIIFIVVGVVGSVFSIMTWNKTADVNETKSVNYDNISEIQIKTISADVEVVTSKQDKALIQLQGKANGDIPELSAKVDGTKLIVELQEDKSTNSWFQLGINFAPETLMLKLHIPEKLLNSLTIDGISADFYVKNIQAKTLGLVSTSGDINGENLQFENAAIQTVSGNVDIQNLAGETSIKTESGDINLSTKEFISPLQIHSTSGDVAINTDNEPTNVTFKVKTVTGDVDILDEYGESTVIGNGSTLIEIYTVSGDISVEN